MTGYEVRNICRSVMGRRKISIESHMQSDQVNYFESLADFFVDKGLSKNEIRKYIISNYRDDHVNFTPFNLMSDDAQQVYKKWKKNNFSKADYYQFINESFNFIENFCINKNITFKKYCRKYLKNHIREEKIDYSIPIYLNLIDIKKLNKLEKILLKKFIKEYNAIEFRIQNKIIKNILKTRSKEMLQMISCSVNRNISTESMTAST